MRTEPLRVLSELGVTVADYEPLAKLLYMNSPEAARRMATKTPSAPASFTDENGVTVLFNDHKWFCFQIAKAEVTMCAVTPAECIEFAEAVHSRPTCAVQEAATCFTYERDGRTSGKCFGTATECQMFYKAFLDERDRVTGPCMTLRYRGH